MAGLLPQTQHRQIILYSVAYAYLTVRTPYVFQQRYYPDDAPVDNRYNLTGHYKDAVWVLSQQSLQEEMPNVLNDKTRDFQFYQSADAPGIDVLTGNVNLIFLYHYRH